LSHEPRRALVDWADLSARLARAAEATRRGDRPSGAEAKAILAARARALAAPAASAPRGGTVPVIGFTLGEERYAL
jgi:hypothetical protein